MLPLYHFSHGPNANLDGRKLTIQFYTFYDDALLLHLLKNMLMYVQAPSPGACVVYIDGAFDLFHAGHVEVPFVVLMQISFLFISNSLTLVLVVVHMLPLNILMLSSNPDPQKC